MPDLDPVAEALKGGDRDRYLSTLYAPEDRRGALQALYAFNVEIARIRDVIREPMPGEIRLQWWREAIGAARSGEAAANPVASALLEVIARHRLPLSTFQAMIDARTFDLYDDPMPDRTTLEGYCGETGSALIQLAAMILDADAAPALAEASGHGGCTQVITGILRNMPTHRRRGQCYVPADILAAAGLDRETFLAGADQKATGLVISAMTALAREHLAAFRQAASGIPVSARPAFLPLAVVPARLDRIERAGPAVLDRTPDIGEVRRQWLMLRAAQRGL